MTSPLNKRDNRDPAQTPPIAVTPPRSATTDSIKRLIRAAALLLVAVLLALAAWVWAVNVREDSLPAGSVQGTAASSPDTVARGEYLARAGNCMTCHTARGGTPFAGGRGIQTPFGTVYSSNLTPDAATGLGTWGAQDFWRALHHGRSKDGRLLYPAFPYTNYTQVSREDADALFAYLRSLPAVAQARPEHTVPWPVNTAPALAVWRALYFSPGVYEPDAAQTAEWNRGAYLVRGLGHCAACHSARNALGGNNSLDLAGGLIPMQNWYAPSLTSNAEAGVTDWPAQDIVSLLKTGVSPRGSVLGPMAEVVQHSTQHLSDQDLTAMAVFLKSLPPTATQEVLEIAGKTSTTGQTSRSPTQLTAGAALYDKHCAQCHADNGQGMAGAYPALAGNRAVMLQSTANLVQIVLNGGYAPATAGNPRPYGMPPFVLTLSDKEVASVLSYIRNTWGNQASEVTAFDVNRARSNNPP